MCVCVCVCVRARAYARVFIFVCMHGDGMPTIGDPPPPPACPVCPHVALLLSPHRLHSVCGARRHRLGGEGSTCDILITTQVLLLCPFKALSWYLQKQADVDVGGGCVSSGPTSGGSDRDRAHGPLVTPPGVVGVGRGPLSAASVRPPVHRGRVNARARVCDRPRHEAKVVTEGAAVKGATCGAPSTERLRHAIGVSNLRARNTTRLPNFRGYILGHMGVGTILRHEAARGPNTKAHARKQPVCNPEQSLLDKCNCTGRGHAWHHEATEVFSGSMVPPDSPVWLCLLLLLLTLWLGDSKLWPRHVGEY